MSDSINFEEIEKDDNEMKKINSDVIEIHDDKLKVNQHKEMDKVSDVNNDNFYITENPKKHNDPKVKNQPIIDHHNSSSFQDDDLMAQINKEAEIISNKITDKDLNIFSKYDKLMEDEMKALHKEKTKEILLRSKDQDKYKAELSKLIEQLNEAIDKSTGLLLKKEKNPQSMKSLEHILEVRKKELNNTKNQIKIFRQQFEIVNAKANERFSNENINEMEEQIDKTKKENVELQKKVRSLKNVQVKQGKELEVLNRNKKYPQKINSQTDDVKSLISKKHEYFSKLINNKKSLLNMKNYLARIYKTLNDIQINPKYYNKLNENMIKQIEEDLNRIGEEIKGDEENILEHVCSPNFNINNLYMYSNNLNNVHLKNQSRQIMSKSPTKNNSPSLLPNILNNRHSHSIKKEYKGIFNKYEYLSSKDKTVKNGKKPKLSPLPKTNNSDIEENSNENNSSDLLKEDEDVIAMDYENTYDSDYINLQKKKDQLDKINSKIERNIKEIEKLYEKKFRDLINTIEHNQKKLKIMQQQNDLLTVEISDLTKIIKLNLEEHKLKKEIRDSESRIFKTIVPINIVTTHPDASETRNDILQDLNNLLIAEGENQKSNKVKERIGVKDNVIEEENPEASSLLENNAVAETNENKNLKFPDISNVEVVVEEDVDTNRREKKLSNIKNKYISIDNEINFYERNI